MLDILYIVWARGLNTEAAPSCVCASVFVCVCVLACVFVCVWWTEGGLHKGRHTVGSDLHNRWQGLQSQPPPFPDHFRVTAEDV